MGSQTGARGQRPQHCCTSNVQAHDQRSNTLGHTEHQVQHAEVLKLIHSRFDSHEFPVVHPEESTVEDVSSAKALVDKVKPDQHKRIQSYVDEKFVEYKDLLPAFDDADW